MKKFVKPSIKIVYIDDVDIIATSSTGRSLIRFSDDDIEDNDQ